MTDLGAGHVGGGGEFVDIRADGAALIGDICDGRGYGGEDGRGGGCGELETPAGKLAPAPGGHGESVTVPVTAMESFAPVGPVMVTVLLVEL